MYSFLVSRYPVAGTGANPNSGLRNLNDLIFKFKVAKQHDVFYLEYSR